MCPPYFIVSFFIQPPLFIIKSSKYLSVANKYFTKVGIEKNMHKNIIQTYAIKYPDGFSLGFILSFSLAKDLSQMLCLIMRSM